MAGLHAVVGRILFGHPADQDQPEVSLRLRCLELAIAAKDDRSIEDRAAAFERYALGQNQTAPSKSDGAMRISELSAGSTLSPTFDQRVSETAAAHARISAIIGAPSETDATGSSPYAWTDVVAAGRPADERS